MCLVDEQVTDLLRAPAVGLTSAVKVAETHEKTEFPPIAFELIACAAQVRSGKCVGSTSRSEAGLKPGVRTRRPTFTAPECPNKGRVDRRTDRRMDRQGPDEASGLKSRRSTMLPSLVP